MCFCEGASKLKKARKGRRENERKRQMRKSLALLFRDCFLCGGENLQAAVLPQTGRHAGSPFVPLGRTHMPKRG